MRKNPDAEKNNPCLLEQEKSFKCFSDNGYNKEACQKEIDNYNLCKSFWVCLQIIFLIKFIIIYFRIQ